MFLVVGIVGVAARFGSRPLAGRALPAIVDRSIGMWLVREVRTRLRGSLVARSLASALPAAGSATRARAGRDRRYDATLARLAAVGVRRAVPIPTETRVVSPEPSPARPPALAPPPSIREPRAAWARPHSTLPSPFGRPSVMRLAPAIATALTIALIALVALASVARPAEPSGKVLGITSRPEPTPTSVASTPAVVPESPSAPVARSPRP